MNLSSLLILKFILFILVIFLLFQILKNNIYFKNLKLIFILFNLIFLCAPIYNFFYISYFIYLSHTAKLMQYDAKYKCIQIEEKFIYGNVSVFLLILELIKIISFGQLYMFLKKYEKYNTVYLVLLSYFFSLFKIIFLLLFIILNYPFNMNVNMYLISCINDLVKYLKNFKIEIFDDSISLNGNQENIFISYIQKALKIYVSPIIDINNSTLKSVVEQQVINLINASYKLSQFQVFNATLNINGKRIPTSKHPTIFNKYLSYSVNITKNTTSNLVEKTEGKTSQMIYEEDNFSKHGVVLNKLGGIITINSHEESTNSIWYCIIMHLFSKAFPIELAKRTECFDIEFLDIINNSEKIISKTILDEGLLKNDISEESLNQRSRIILSNTFAEMFCKIRIKSDIIEAFLEINNNNDKNDLN